MRLGCINAIDESLQKKNYTMSEVGIADIRHFLYKSRSSAQYTSPDYSAPYSTPVEQDRLFLMYQFIHSRMHSQARPVKILFHVGQAETILGWVSRLTKVLL